MRDELRSSSPETHQDAPLFLPAESQIPFPYSQWTEEAKNSESDDEEEEEVAKAVKSSSQRPSTTSYRRLTDIASQPNVFSSRPTLRSAAFPSSSLPQSKDKRSELYGTLARDEDESDSDSDAGDEPSHIPKSRQAGAQKR
ncbi:hypothetical protein FB45DRAFT_191152 [Roridomyces roridus]|uniref:Uncharacterized protein n=1 Tax=Roridomyces roridus TaxID=1738132 RepID=A0AAD7CEY2_9AGAR|nr:hypothetical protein FB45DRAFT_191152 [Roridomyces roridus]